MDDRALLEAAAKAAGLVIDKSPYNGGGHDNTGFDACGNAVLDWHNGTSWNPLRYDEDALRLAVRLELNVFQAAKSAHAMDKECDIEARERHDGDPYAATRRAIVRAAAELAPKD